MSCAHCAHCPTAQGQAHGYDPEAYDLLQDAQWVEVEIAEGADISPRLKPGGSLNLPAST
jgi:hypothetical protein